MDNDVEARIWPRRSWLVQLTGAIFFGVVIAVVLGGHVKDFPWRTGAILGAAYLLGLLVVALRPPILTLRHDSLSVRRFFGSLDVPRRHVVGYFLLPASRVIGGQTNSSNRHLFLDVRMSGSIERVPAFWCRRFLGLLYAQEIVKVEQVLKKWVAESDSDSTGASR
jgi:hypothetical protein